MSKFKQITTILNTTIRRLSSSSSSVDLKDVVGSKICNEIEKVHKFRKACGNAKIGDFTVNMMYGGMRGILGLVCETSMLDPEDGIRIRGYTIPQLQEKLPKAPGGTQPLPEGVFWLMLTSEIPTQEQVTCVSHEWAKRSYLPEFVYKVLNSLPNTLHPMSQLACALTCMNHDSEFVKAYHCGVHKSRYWEYMYEDSMNLIARITVIAGIIYRNTYKNRSKIPKIEMDKDWSYNFTKMLGFNDESCIEMIRLYLTLHCDHEGGNVSSHTTHLVGSSLSDSYLAYASGVNGLAGPLHGLANQEVLVWLQKLQSEVGGEISDKQLEDYILKTLETGSVIPGYGHAVLRKTDPRFTCLREFSQKNLPNDPLFKLVSQVYKIVPKVLENLGKVKNPWPNVDAHSGVLLQYYGLKELQFYTVMFAVSRAMGVLASLIWDRALGLPIERPKSTTSENLMKVMGYDPNARQ